jgi:hypothetical protein
LDNSGKCALLHACARGHLDCVRFLMAHCDWPVVGAPFSRRQAAQQGLVAAVRGAKLNVAEFLIDFDEAEEEPTVGQFSCCSRY